MCFFGGAKPPKVEPPPPVALPAPPPPPEKTPDAPDPGAKSESRSVRRASQGTSALTIPLNLPGTGKTGLNI